MSAASSLCSRRRVGEFEIAVHSLSTSNSFGEMRENSLVSASTTSTASERGREASAADNPVFSSFSLGAEPGRNIVGAEKTVLNRLQIGAVRVCPFACLPACHPRERTSGPACLSAVRSRIENRFRNLILFPISSATRRSSDCSM